MAISDANKKASVLAFDKVLGLKLNSVGIITIPVAVQKLIDEREVARRGKDWKKADLLRAQITEFGFDIKDTSDSFTISSNKRPV